MVGYRFGGWTGAAAAVGGFVGWPCLVVIGMGILYQHYGALPQVQRALAGMSIVAAGLLFATFVKVAKVLPPRCGLGCFVYAGVCRRRRFALAALLGRGHARALGSLCGLERESVMDRVDLSALFLHSLVLWFVAVGGPSTILPDFHRYVVESHQLMTSTEFAELYTLAQADPAPTSCTSR